MSNKLELTWVGKDRRQRLEPRVLLEDVESSYRVPIGKSSARSFDNSIIHGDNLLALKALESQLSGAVKCIYIDPPFNTQQAMEHYDDGVEHSIWLGLMRDRLEILHRLLSRDGSLFIHIDDNELGYLIALVDEIFGRKNRIAVITFKQSAASGPKAINPGLVSTSNFILYYVKDKEHWEPNRVYVPIERDGRYNNYIENRSEPYSKWKITTLRQAFATAQGLAVRELDQKFGSKLAMKLEEFVLQNAERVVQPALVRPEDINAEARAALAESAIKQDVVTKSPREERYFLNGKQLLFYSAKTRVIDGRLTTAGLLTTIWDDLLSNNIHKEGGVSFPNGKKPEALLKRVLELSTAAGDFVLDSFAGSGTTAAVAHKMRRRWVVIEQGEHARTHIVPRLRAVVEGTDKSGVTDAVGWTGGGSFRFYRLAPSLLERDEYGNWVISPKYNAAMLAEALCKFEGYQYDPSPSVYWQHGKSADNAYIYVTTQTLTAEQLRHLNEEVGPKRSLLICCGSFSAKSADAFPRLTIKKIPKTVLHRCEWGRDDYSLAIKELSVAQEKPAKPVPKADAAEKKAQRKNAVSLLNFGDD